ncbi:MULTISPECIES: competence/damage-inducible protein A [Bacillus]|uniref:Putative competence-damage inducible protein n=1 Tax=Bacillus velezensis TaxID=492670 RepID=A0A7W4LSF0_BACVE|nr:MULTISPECIES: competence/damage-inducible protein A [Bacillus]ASB53166.1 Nicotinamide-nucleotide amidase [Bacillus velezensis]AVB11342.1 competence/damage-inducible protein A [Bacillus velezensis]AWQ16932.1 competence/damage-inducible protein A [Bacillus velezensis]AXS60798.1 competence/damage-inducible protein A [Bacillus velezensis]AYV19283.1 competence/damage-inducible protein A [Bacillus velezensis]
MEIAKKAEIIAVGSELLLGQIANTNAQFISKELAEIGVNVFYHTAVGDNPERLKHVIRIAEERSDLIIFSGGLGPTKDDLTKETIANTLGRPLVLNDEAFRSIEEYFVKTKRTMSPNNRKQALVIEGSDVLANHFGMAPGMLAEHGSRLYMLLPGPPSELRPMFENEAKPLLLKKLGSNEKIVSTVLRFFGIGESQLEADLEDIIDAQTNPTIAPLAADGEVTLRLTAKHADEKETERLLKETEAAILERVGEFFYGYDDTSLVKELSKACRQNKITISSAESFTGGLFSEWVTDLRGASQLFAGGVVCYSDSVKQHVLGVKAETLAESGAVSKECAKELAAGVRKLTGSDIGISFTGVAGPDPQEGHAPGRVFIGISAEGKEEVHEFNFAGSRTGIRKRAAKYGCHLILKMLDQK